MDRGASSGRGVVAAIGGGLAGLLLFGSLGCALGFAFLSLFGPESCCGLEGLLAPFIGVAVGAVSGLVAGAVVAWRASERRGRAGLGRLVLLLLGGFAVAWGIGETVFTYDYEDGGPVFLFFSLALGVPLLAWAFWSPTADRGSAA